MKRFILSCIGFFVVFSFTSCSKNPSDVLGKLQNLYKAGNYEDVKSYYTKGSIEAMNELEKLVPKSQNKEAKVDKKFVEGAKWEVVSEKINGDVADLKIKYVEHPVENMKGLEITFKMKREDGEWKIDMEKELRMSLDMIKGMHQKMNFFKQ